MRRLILLIRGQLILYLDAFQLELRFHVQVVLAAVVVSVRAHHIALFVDLHVGDMLSWEVGFLVSALFLIDYAAAVLLHFFGQEVGR